MHQAPASAGLFAFLVNEGQIWFAAGLIAAIEAAN